MRTLKIVGLIFFGGCLGAQASSYWNCKYDAKIISIKKISTMNLQARKDWRTGKDNYTYIASLILTNGRKAQGSHRDCSIDGREIEVILESEKKYNYKIDDEFVVEEGGGDSRGGSFWYYVNEVN